MNCRKVVYKVIVLVVFLSLVVTINMLKVSDDGSVMAVTASSAVTKITLDHNAVTVKAGQSVKIVASTVPANKNSELVWISNNKNIATVDSNGNVKGINLGTAYIIVVSKNNYSVRANCKVTVTGSSQNSSSTNNSTNSNSSNNSNSSTTNSSSNNSNTNNNSSSSSSSNTNNKNTTSNQTNNSTTVVKSKVTAADFIKSLEKMSKTAQKDYKNGRKWKYSNSNTSRSFDKAVSSKNRKTNCARYVSWALIDIGILDYGEGFYKRSKNEIKYYVSGSSEKTGTDVKNKMKSAFIYINGNKKSVSKLISEGKLKAGDIVLWYSHQHTNVYAGNKKWYDAGRWSANKGSTGFTTFGPVKISALNSSWKVWRILRIK